MSIYQFIASNRPLKNVINPYVKLLSINDMIAMKMEIPNFLLKATKDRDEKITLHCESEAQLDEIEIMTEINMPIESLATYTMKKYIASLTWRYTDQRAETLLEYLQDHMKSSDEVEVWNTWLNESVEDPKIVEIKIQDLKIKMIKECLGKGFYESASCIRISK